MKRFNLLILTGAALLGASWQLRGAQPQPSSDGPDEMPAYQKLGYAERIIESFYVDSVAPGKLVEEAIVSMLHTLDPDRKSVV